MQLKEKTITGRKGKARDRLTILHIGTLNKPIRPDQGYCPVETVIYNIDKGLAEMGHRSIVACSADSQNVGEKYVTVHQSFGDYACERSQERQELLERHLSRSLKRTMMGDIDVVHMHEWIDRVYDGTFNPSLPIVMTLHVPASDSSLHTNDEASNETWVNPSVYFNAISHYQKREYSKIINIYKVVHHGVDVEIDPLPNTPTDKSYLFTIGRITRVKGQDKAIELARKTGSKLIIAGCVQNKPEDKVFFEHLKDSINLTVDVGKFDVCNHYYRLVIKPLVECDKQIIYIGELNKAQKELWYKHAKATILPIQWGEPFGLVAVESMACGTPVLTMNKGAMPEIVVNRKTGFVVNSLTDMIAAVGRLDMIDRRQCRHHAQKSFSVARMVRDYDDVYRQVIEKHQSKAGALLSH